MNLPLRRIVLATAAFLGCLGAAEPAAHQQAPQVPAVAAIHPALWKVSDADTTIYLFGTVHALPAHIDWYGGKVADSFEHSQELVTEILESGGDDVQSAILAKAMLPAGATLRGLMSASERTAYEQALAREGMPADALDRFKPWWGAVFLATMPILKQGFDPKNGVEAGLDARARGLSHPHSALETAEYQLGLFDSLPQDVQLHYLAEVVRTMPEAKNELSQMIEAWKQGDADELARLMNQDEDEPALMEKLLYARNRAWAAWIRTRLDRPGTVFIAVGAGHLAGTGSVQDDLRAMGIASVRVQSPPRQRLPVWLAALALLASCTPSPEPARAALWRIDGPHGQQGWLFGTIHALARPALWRTPAVAQALSQADEIVVEVGNLDDKGAMAREFQTLAASQGQQPPLTQRVEPKFRQPLLALLKRGGYEDDGFAHLDTWAAALSLARVGEGSLDSDYGIDRSIIRGAGGKPVVEIEGAHEQLETFERMPEAEQRDLLQLVVADAGSDDTESGSLAQAWRQGDMATIERETHRGLLSDPELREALYAGRNRAWEAKIAGMLASGRHPFVAVGAAHMAGLEGLPSLLAGRGYTVTRVQ